MTQVARFLALEAPLEAELLANATWASPESVTSSSSLSGLSFCYTLNTSNNESKDNNNAVAINSNVGVTVHATSDNCTPVTAVTTAATAAAAPEASSTTSQPPSSGALSPDFASESNSNLFGDYVDRTGGLVPNHSTRSTHSAAPALIEDLFGLAGPPTPSVPAETSASAAAPATVAAPAAPATAPAPVTTAKDKLPLQPPQQVKQQQEVEVKGRGRTSSLSDGFVVSGLEPDPRPATSSSSSNSSATTGASLSTLLVRCQFCQVNKPPQ